MAELPVMKLPPWNHTSTGSGDAPREAHTLSERHASSSHALTSSSGRTVAMPGPCGAAGPNAAASRVPGHGRGGSGGRQRGALANGTPRNTASAPSSRPSTRPAVVATVGITR
jgi:hypothetical protein